MKIFWSKKAFREAAVKEVYHGQKPKGFEKMIPAFIDSLGRKYFKYEDPMDMPLLRKGKLDEYIKWLSRGLTDNELDMFLTAMDAAVDECINTLDKSGRIKHVGKIKALNDEMRVRQSLTVHHELYFRIMGVSYIREDQNPAEWDESLETEKVAQFKEDSKNGLAAFFLEGPLSQHIAFCELSETELTELMNESRIKAEATRKWIDMLMSAEK